MTFLIADDSPQKTFFLQHMLARSGWAGEIFAAETTEAARTLIDSQTIDAAFIDFYIPSENGPSLIKYLKSAHPKAKIALVSSSDTPANFRQAKEAGAEATICTTHQQDFVEKTVLDLLSNWQTELAH
jgi:DNA-binding NarL/FixJ family response regulator